MTQISSSKTGKDVNTDVEFCSPKICTTASGSLNFLTSYTSLIRK